MMIKRGLIYGLVLGAPLALGACNDPELARQQYTEGANAAREAGCECDPFFSETGGEASQTASASTQWVQGYVNTCVTLSRKCTQLPSEAQ